MDIPCMEILFSRLFEGHSLHQGVMSVRREFNGSSLWRLCFIDIRAATGLICCLIALRDPTALGRFRFLDELPLGLDISSVVCSGMMFGKEVSLLAVSTKEHSLNQS
jgi:hypothetical protein